VGHLKARAMTSKQDVNSEQQVSRLICQQMRLMADPKILFTDIMWAAVITQFLFFVELLRQVPSLSSEEPEAILRLVSRLDEIHALGLTDDKMFVICILPLVFFAVLRFFGDCFRNGRNWEQCKIELFKEFFPHFVRERMIRDHIVFSFHEEGQPLREYIDRMFAAARFLGYEASEQQLVDRVDMNLHPT